MKINLFEYINGQCYYDGILKFQNKNSQGYLRIIINDKNYRVHRLVAQRYIPNLFNYKVVGHLDNNKLNNSISNLKWISHSENSILAYKQIPSMKNMHKNTKGGKLIIASKEGVELEFKSLRDCAKHINRNVAGVHRVLKGEWNKCAGWQLNYK